MSTYSISEKLQRLLSRRAGGTADVYARVQLGANRAATSAMNGRPEPTPAEADANAYKLGRFVLHGLPIAIENPCGTVRSGMDPNGNRWSNLMRAHYGEISGTMGADGDAIDVFIGPFPESQNVWVINQSVIGGSAFDEVKIMLGFADEAMARAGYETSYSQGWSGLQSIHRTTLAQLKWWLKDGNSAGPFDPSQLPSDGCTIMDNIAWTDDAEPVGTTYPKLLYKMRCEDTGGLLLDGVDLATMLADDGIEAEQVLDALVVKVAKMAQRMDLLKRVMNATSAGPSVTDYEISNPIRLRGTLQVVVMFALSDGQAVSIWFHNPDTTPNKLTPMDDLVSWKWMLNKKDITLVVAPERGQELLPREVARRVMRLAARNSEAFQKANSKLAEKTAALAALDAEIGDLETQLSELSEQIAAARIAAIDRARVPSIDQQGAAVTTAAGYAAIRNDEAALLKWQDWLDPFFQHRIIEVRAALRALGWDGAAYQPLKKGDYTLVIDTTKVGAGGNVVGVTYYVGRGSVIDGLEAPPADVAFMVDALTLIADNADTAPVPPTELPVAVVAAQPIGMVANDSPDRIGSSVAAREVAINEALRALGFTGDVGAPLEKSGYFAYPATGITSDDGSGFHAWKIMGMDDFTVNDGLGTTPDEVAAVINAAVESEIARKAAQQELPLEAAAVVDKMTREDAADYLVSRGFTGADVDAILVDVAEFTKDQIDEAAQAFVAASATEKESPRIYISLSPWSNPTTGEQRVYVNGAASDATKVWLERSEMDEFNSDFTIRLSSSMLTLGEAGNVKNEVEQQLNLMAGHRVNTWAEVLALAGVAAQQPVETSAVEPAEEIAAAGEAVAAPGPQEGEQRRTTDGEIVFFEGGKWWTYVDLDESGEIGSSKVQRVDPEFVTEEPAASVAPAIAAAEETIDPAAVELQAVSAEAAKRGLTAERESHKYLAGVWFYAIKKDGVDIGRLYPPERVGDPYFKVTTGEGENIGEFDAHDAMTEIVAQMPAAPLAVDAAAGPVVDDPGVGLAADRAWLQSLIDGTGDLAAPDVFERLERMFDSYATVPLMAPLVEQAAEAYSARALADAQQVIA